MDDKEKDQIRRTLETYGTEKLLEVWRSEGEAEWAEEAVAIAGEILTRRLGELPPRAGEVEEDEDDALDELYDERLGNIRFAERAATWSKRLAFMFIVLLSLQVIATVLDILERGADAFRTLLSAIIVSFGTSLLFCLGGYVLFNGLGAGLQLLADIANNSRTPEKVLSKSLQHK